MTGSLRQRGPDTWELRVYLGVEQDSQHHLKPLLGEIRVNKLTTIDIDDMYRLLSRCGGRDGRPLTAGTVHRVHVVLHRALTQAVRWEWIWLNRAANSSPPRVIPAEIRPPTPDQIQRLVASVEETDLDFATYLWLAASTGARRSQMLGLRWADIDFTHSAIGFSRAYVEGPSGPVLRATKTHRTYRVALDHASMQRLHDRGAFASRRIVSKRHRRRLAHGERFS